MGGGGGCKQGPSSVLWFDGGSCLSIAVLTISLWPN